ncbi:MAG: PIG-L deacetylase family protein [Dehalococcoidia bacterium]|jgi:LmbE family N-acetylglucosaminyl deacetylase
MQKIMVIVAHSDDEVLGCGGSIAKHYKAGDAIRIIYMTSILTSRGGNVNLSKERRRALWVLGPCIESVAYGFPDQMLDTIPYLELTKAIECEIDAFRPDIVYTHTSHDNNIDHGRVAFAVLPAVRPYRRPFIKKVRRFEIPPIDNDFVPNEWEDVASTIKIKLRALEAYKHELRKWPDPRSIESVEALARARGTGRSGFAEAFETIGEY